MTHAFTEYLWFFIIYAFLGWCVEVAFHAVTSGKFVNRGFLNGPVCPIYGFGMIVLIFSLEPLVDNFVLLFLGSFILTSVLEFITGFILEKVFRKKWWDYSDMPFNIKGYVCLSFSIAWGLGAVFILNVIHPTVYGVVSLLNNHIGQIMLVLLLTLLVFDFIITVTAILEIKRRIHLLDELGEKLKSYSDGIGENIYKGMIAAIKRKDHVSYRLRKSKSDFEIALERRKAHIAELKVKYENVLKEKSFVHKRLEKAFPNIKDKLQNFEHQRKNKNTGKKL